MKHLRFRLASVLELSLLLGLFVSRAAQAATTLTVTDCSNDSQLQAAVNTANIDNAGDIIKFACSGDIRLTGTLTITGNMTLDGSGQTVALDGQQQRQVLFVSYPFLLTLNALTIANGVAVSGGGITNEGALLITNCTFSGNSAFGVPGGGGINSHGSIGLRISNSTFSGNSALHDGGGIFTDQGVEIANSTFSGNSALRGGGIFLDQLGGSVIDSSTFYGNSALQGGAIFTTSKGPEHAVSIRASTIAGNSASGVSGGGGIASGTDGAHILWSIVADNTGGDCSMSVSDGGQNLESGTSCGFITRFSLQNTDPKLDPSGLQNNGGFTQTLALKGDSPAIDQIFAPCFPTDQRGVPRPQGLRCDMGAFEATAVPLVNDLVSLDPIVTTFNPTPVQGGPAGTFSITSTFTNTSSSSIHDPFFMVSQLSGGNLLLDADGGPGGFGARLTPDVGADKTLAPGESFTTKFIVGLQYRSNFTFLVDLFGEPTP